MVSPFTALRTKAQAPTLPDHITNLNIYSRGVSVASGSMSGEKIVNNQPVIQNWDVNRIYAVSNSSNSGYNILSAYADGHKVRYKESPNAFLFKTTGIAGLNNDAAVKIYPNPAQDKLFIEADGKYSYS